MTEIRVWGIGSTRSLRVHWTLQELGLDYDTRPIRTRTPEQKGPEFLAVNPQHKIPTVEIDGNPMTESGAIALELADRFRGAVDLWPAASRGRVLEWCFHVAMELDATSLYVIRRHGHLPEEYGAAPQVVDAARTYWLKQVGKEVTALSDGRPHLLGERFSVADIMLVSCVGWASMYGVAVPEPLLSYEARAKRRPAYARAAEANRS